MKNKEKPFCKSAQRTKSYVTVCGNGSAVVIRSIAHFYAHFPLSTPNR